MHPPLVSYVASPSARFDDHYGELVAAVEGAGAEVVVETGTAVDGRTLPGWPPAGAVADTVAGLALVARWAERRPDLVHVADVRALPAVVRASRRVGDVPVIATLHAPFEGLVPTGAGIRARRTRRRAAARLCGAVRAANRWIALNAAARDSWCALGVPRDRVVLLDSGWGVPLGGLVERAAQPGGGGASVRVAARGAPVDLAAFRDALAGAGMVANVVGIPSEAEQRRATLEGADIFVALDSIPGRSLEVQEAMALARPVIAPRTAEHMRAVRDRETGVLYPPGELEVAAKAVVALADANVRAEAGRRGRALAARLFDRDLAVTKVLALYDELLSGESPAPAHVTANGQVVGGRELV